MSILQSIWNRTSARAFLERLVLICLCLRALIPAGYMPDMDALQVGEFRIVICSATGTKTIAVDKDGLPHTDRNASHHDQPCAFSTLAHSSVDLPELLAFAAPEYPAATANRAPQIQLPPTRAGPVLGSRGPPQLS
jgi:hypothetical protein